MSAFGHKRTSEDVKSTSALPPKADIADAMTHTWSHKDLARIPYEKAQQQIEMANSAVSAAAGRKIAPFFRFPYLAQPPRIVTYLAERNIAIFSGDIDSRDYTMHEPQPVVKATLSR